MPDGAPLTARMHPYAELFPPIEGEAFDHLVADIKRYGLRQPIVEFDHAILDGANRYRACLAAGVEPQFEVFEGSDPLGFVLSANLQRRHLTEGQRAMIAARLANMPVGRPSKAQKSASLQNIAASQADAATKLQVSTRSVADAKKVRDQGTPELIGRVERGDLGVALAAKVAALPEEKQKAVLAQDDDDVRGFLKRERRAARESALAESTRTASEQLGQTLYSVIYADPPWRFEPYSRDTGMDRAADNHYPTMDALQIAQVEPPVAEDAVLFLWVTAPLLLAGISVITHWGFTYRSNMVWVKDRAGTGYWWRSQHEQLLVATRGKIPAPAPGSQFASVLTAPVGRHSEKPAEVAEMIETLFPNCRRLEMFARTERPGWDSWGNEVAP